MVKKCSGGIGVLDFTTVLGYIDVVIVSAALGVLTVSATFGAFDRLVFGLDFHGQQIVVVCSVSSAHFACPQNSLLGGVSHDQARAKSMAPANSTNTNTTNTNTQPTNQQTNANQPTNQPTNQCQPTKPNQTKPTNQPSYRLWWAYRGPVVGWWVGRLGWVSGSVCWSWWVGGFWSHLCKRFFCSKH